MKTKLDQNLLSPLLASALALLLPCDALGQTAYPSKPVSLIYPFTPGGGTEQVTRTVMAEAAKFLGQPIIFENRPGANSRQGINAQRGAPPDGYVLSVAIDGLLVSQPLVDPSFRLEPGKDYVPVALLFQSPLALVGHPSLPFRDLKGLIAYARTYPGKLNVAMANASSSHFIAERFRQAAGIEVTFVPYKGSSSALVDLMGGRVDLTFNTGSKGHVDAGKLVAFATTGNQRWEIMPSVPTLAESGVPVATTIWFALIAHPATPRDVVIKLNGAINHAMKSGTVVRHLEDVGWKSYPAMSQEETTAYIRDEIEAWSPVIRRAGIKLQ